MHNTQWDSLLFKDWHSIPSTQSTDVKKINKKEQKSVTQLEATGLH